MKTWYNPTTWFSSPQPQALVDTMRTPPKGQRTLPSYLSTAKPSTTSALPKTDLRLATTDITTFRGTGSTSATIRKFIKASPDLSAAVAAYVRMAVTKGYTAVAHNRDGSVNPQATTALAGVVSSLDYIGDYSIGFDDAPTFRSLAETWSLDLMGEGRMAGELVLDKALLPYKLQAIASAQIQLYPSKDGKRTIPHQKVGGEDIPLDYPTFFMVSLDLDADSAHPSSPLEPAIQPVQAAADFFNDVRRIIKKALHPRNVVTIKEDALRKSIPPEIQGDHEKSTAFKNAVFDGVQQKISGLQPEEALVMLDTMTMDVVDHGNTNLSNEYTVVESMIRSKLATGAKVMPTILGYSDGTSNVASSETLVFLKFVEGALWSKLNEMFSKMLTLAIRLLGHDVYVKFSFSEIELRPESELEAFRAMKQSRVLELLSLGLMSDEEAAIQLTGHLPSGNFKPLSGTGFKSATAAPAGDGYNGASNSGSTLNQNLNSPAPKNPKSQNGGKPGADVVPLRG